MSSPYAIQGSAHPMDLLPLLRRWAPSPWRDLLYTAIWNASVAVVLAVINLMYGPPQYGFLHYLWPNFLVGNIVGFMIHGSVHALNWLLGGWPKRAGRVQGLLYLTAVIGVCLYVGIAVGSGILRGDGPQAWFRSSTFMAQVLPFVLVLMVVMLVVLAAGEGRLRTDTLVARQQQQIAESARLLAEARLRGLQAQIEPHFLYNTLANVVSLIGTQPDQARHMLERFIDFLRASLATSRADQSTLGAEADLAEAYLAVLQVRMGARLRYRVEMDQELRTLPLAPMLIQPLVENAIAHGLEPKVDGGEVRLAASRDGDTLLIEVRDTGVGLTGDGTSAKPGGGVGLGNLRERIASVYGPSARVQLRENQGGGLAVRLVLPLSESDH